MRFTAKEFNTLALRNKKGLVINKAYHVILKQIRRCAEDGGFEIKFRFWTDAPYDSLMECTYSARDRIIDRLRKRGFFAEVDPEMCPSYSIYVINWRWIYE